jgi:DNA repair exonuclease SbcCD ATPase subunit
MIIANPIYDTVFKKLMENERLSKFFIGTLLEQTIVSLEMNPQEFTYKRIAPEDDKSESNDSKGLGYSVFRLDFVATVRTETGEQKKILIEVQKAWDKDDLMRFRNYLGEQYKKIDKINGEEVVLPITTIYVLDFNLPEIESACLKVERGSQDMISRKPITVRSPFLEKLTHDSYVVQTKRIKSDRYQTRLDKLLSIFEQAYFVGDAEITKMYNYQPDDEDVKEMIDLLHYVGTDPAERRELEMEQEAIRVWKVSFAKVNKALEKVNKALEKKDKVLEEKDKALEEKDKALEEKDKALEEKDNVLEEKDKVLEEKDKVLEEKDKALEEKDKVIEDLVKSNEEQAKAIAAIKRQLDEMQRR